ncbi:cysteine-rich secretory protein 2-like [Esox lucius]|uniref:SCP domain-containing protein n=1 Tax=Esox lucius TaxID=8010 RepID=A0A6Q2Y570_ESOLU|nr:cysteine-rich secretory protein 2-like [Esox lucius]
MATMTLFISVVGLLALLQPYCLLADTNTQNPAVQKEIVDLHNDLRRGVQPPARNMLQMSWNNEAAINAQKWANQCTMSHSPADQRRTSTSGCGENLFMSTNERPWTSAIQSWYSEVNNYNYDSNGSINGKVVGHYTQVVWATSKEIGCAVAKCPNSVWKFYYVCQYCPPGNYVGRKPYNTGSRCADCPNNCQNGLCQSST